MAFTGTALNAYVKRTYDPKYIENSMTSVEDVTLKDIKKETDGSGDQYSWLADADDSFNGSADFIVAQNAATNNANTVGSKFLADWSELSAVAQITSSIIGKTRNNDGAWQKAVDVAMRKTMKGIAHANAIFLQGQGWGELSQISSVSGSTFVPTIASDITKYVKGMPLHFSSSKNAAGLRSSTVIYVTKVSYTKGAELVTTSATLASVSAVNTDWCFIAGCRQDSATPSRLVPAGFTAWYPNQNTSQDLTDATITTIYGVDRSTNSRLYGSFIDATGGGSVLGYLIDGAQEAMTIGNAKKLKLYCSKATFNTVAKDLQASVRYMNNVGEKGIGSTSLLVVADGDATATLHVSRTMNDNFIVGYDPTHIVQKSIGGAPHIDMEDGLTMARQASSQGYEVRWFQQQVYEFTNPAAGLRIQLV